ncbi:protein kinase-like domain-containing protein [Artemisia annua]|uniref:Protein kinase-like domain-containing protein n=1 Tax=Artemisia annua TaxID=35608 RepID=A0A2U1LI89_ARTAN|nr:protein kinase-like domain-containing protein [Artemisia annua]
MREDGWFIVPLYHFTTQHTTADLQFQFQGRWNTLLVAGFEFQPSEGKLFSLNEKGEHCHMISMKDCLIPNEDSTPLYGSYYWSRFPASFYQTNNKGFKTHVKTQLLSPSITYTVNLVYYNSSSHKQVYVDLKYRLRGEATTSIVYLANRRDDDQLYMAELYQFTSDGSIVDLEIIFENSGTRNVVEGIPKRSRRHPVSAPGKRRTMTSHGLNLVCKAAQVEEYLKELEECKTEENYARFIHAAIHSERDSHVHQALEMIGANINSYEGNNSELYYQLGIGLYRIGDAKGAKKALEDCLKIDQTFWEARSLLENVELVLGRDEAKATRSKSLKHVAAACGGLVVGVAFRTKFIFGGIKKAGELGESIEKMTTDGTKAGVGKASFLMGIVGAAVLIGLKKSSSG